MPDNSGLVIATELHTKFCQDYKIEKTYKDAINLWDTETYGFDFLQLLLQKVHHLLAVQNIATVNIQKYSSFKNLFQYAKEID